MRSSRPSSESAKSSRLRLGNAASFFRMTDGATAPALIEAASLMISSQCSRMTSMRIGRLNRRLDPFVGGGFLNSAETIILEIAKARHEAESEEMAQREDVIVRSARVGIVLLDGQDGAVMQKAVEDMGSLAHGGRNDLAVKRPILIRNMRVEEHPRIDAVFGVDLAEAWPRRPARKNWPSDDEVAPEPQIAAMGSAWCALMIVPSAAL